MTYSLQPVLQPVAAVAPPNNKLAINRVNPNAPSTPMTTPGDGGIDSLFEYVPSAGNWSQLAEQN
jgi:hypothetical protein